MKLLKLYLKNYLNIFNAIGLSEITIDFSKCKNRILVIRSENGSGKSSLINELHPFFSNPNVWMTDVPIIKIIEFLLDDNTILSITYHGFRSTTNKPKQSKCYIKRIYQDNSIIELNPNGNITSGKDIICSLLDINDDYILLSSLSANSKGIGAMKPSERKKFLSLIISSLDPYIKINKMITQKYTTLKSMIQSLNAKIFQLGNIELIQTNIEKDSKELSILEDKKESLIIKKSSIDTRIKLLMKDNKNPNEIYNKYIIEQMQLNHNINDIKQEDLEEYDENKLIELEKNNSILDSKINIYTDRLNEILEKEKKLRNELVEYDIKLKSLFDEKIMKDTENKLENAKKNLNLYTSYFKNLGFDAYENLTEQEYSIAIDTMEKFNQTILRLGDEYSIYVREEAIKYIDSEFKIIDYEKVINDYKYKIDKIKDNIKDQKDLQLKSKDYVNIPFDCNHINDCPFIKTIIESKNLLLSEEDFVNLENELNILNTNLDTMKDLFTKQNEILKCISDIKFLFNYINSMKKLLLKFPNTDIIKSNSHIFHCITHTIQINLNLSLYKEYTNYISMISHCKEDIKLLEEKLDSLINANKESWKLQQTIEMKNNEMNEIMNLKIKILEIYNALKNEKNTISIELTKMRNNKELREKYKETLEKLNIIDKEIELIKKDVTEYDNLNKELVEINENLNNISLNSIPQLKNNIEQAKYRMVLYEQYRKDYAYYSEMFDKLEMVKHDSSIHGIQAEIMNIQMTEMISMINQLAAIMFGARFSLQKFEITSDHFNIPVLDKETNEIRPDISMMSNSQLSQLSMIISFVLLYNSSKNYNIIRLDEVDNNLDNDNRMRFFDLINTIMDILHFDQCVIISHNYELDLFNCDLIITKIQNPEIYNSVLHSGANIIANFMENK